jgi:ATP-dependent protease HslVU (ClpYQ) peptidase subunit
MTTIVMIEKKNSVKIGFDSQVSHSWEVGDLEQPKVFAKNGVVYGVAGAVLAANVIRHSDLPSAGDTGWDVDRWVARELIPVLRERLRGAGLVSTGKIDTDAHLLAAVNGRVYFISSDTSFTRFTTGVYTIGSGTQFAKGAISAGAGIRKAIEIAAEFDPGTGGHITVTDDKALLG